jgi:uncharacterized protein DUF6894
MARYYFHIDDGSNISDDVGTELRTLAEAKCAAVQYAGQLICDAAGEFWDAAQWSMTVADATGLTLFTLEFAGTESPAIQAQPRFGTSP